VQTLFRVSRVSRPFTEAATPNRENARPNSRLTGVAAPSAEIRHGERRKADLLRMVAHRRVGKRAWTLSPDDLRLPMEEAEPVRDVLAPARETAEATPRRAHGDTPRKSRCDCGYLPAHLPRIERVVAPAGTLCSPLPPGGCGKMSRVFQTGFWAPAKKISSPSAS
jgi:hypothetical protein